jgi:hypothetical protein
MLLLLLSLWQSRLRSATKLPAAQPHLSQEILKLEREIGVDLVGTARSVALTSVRARTLHVRGDAGIRKCRRRDFDLADTYEPPHVTRSARAISSVLSGTPSRNQGRAPAPRRFAATMRTDSNAPVPPCARCGSDSMPLALRHDRPGGPRLGTHETARSSRPRGGVFSLALR